MLRLPRDRLVQAALTSASGVAWLGALVALSSCAGTESTPSRHAIESHGARSRIEERALSDRPPLSIIERRGDPEAVLAFASLASDSAELHAAFGEVLSQRLSRAGLPAQLVAHGLGFELTLLAGSAARAGSTVQALLAALAQPVTEAELAAAGPPDEAAANTASGVAQCSGELPRRRRVSDARELERERIATFARDRAAWGLVGDENAAASVARALAAGADWPELGRVRSKLPTQSVTEVLRGERATLSVALTVNDTNRALGAAALLGQAASGLSVRLAALGAGLRLRYVGATAHPLGACLRMDSDLDASPIADSRRLGFAIHAMQEESAWALSRARDENRLESAALSAPDPRVAARAAAYRALVATRADVPRAELVALTAPDDAPLAPSIDAATEQARRQVPQLDTKIRVEAGQPAVWALVSTPCAAATERADNAGHAAVLFAAAANAAHPETRLEPWIGTSGLGILGFVERAPGESTAEAAARLGDALGRALLAPPSPLEVAAARNSLLTAAGSEPQPLLERLLETLAPAQAGALLPRGSLTSLQAASREAVVARQRELLRLPHRLAVLSPTSASDGAAVAQSLARWLRHPDSPRPSPCEEAAGAPARTEILLESGAALPKSSYLGFRIPSNAWAAASVLGDLLNSPDGALSQALSEPDLVGVARSMLLGTDSARALVVQVSAFEGQDQEALARVQRLFENLARSSALSTSHVDAAMKRQRVRQRLAALDPRYRLVRLLEPDQPAVVDEFALRKLAASLQPESAVVARAVARTVPSRAGKTPPGR